VVEVEDVTDAEAAILLDDAGVLLDGVLVEDVPEALLVLVGVDGVDGLLLAAAESLEPTDAASAILVKPPPGRIVTVAVCGIQLIDVPMYSGDSAVKVIGPAGAVSVVTPVVM
jgi:hypothetical protein